MVTLYLAQRILRQVQKSALEIKIAISELCVHVPLCYRCYR